VIGIVYAVSAAVAILVMSKATQETEHLKEMLVGNILSVTWPELARTAILYSLVGVFHYIFRERFLIISMGSKPPITGPRSDSLSRFTACACACALF